MKIQNNGVLRTEDKRRWETYIKNQKNASLTADLLGISYSAFRDWKRKFLVNPLVVAAGGDLTKEWWKAYIKRDPMTQPSYEPREPEEVVTETRREQEVRRLRKENKDLAAQLIYGQDLRSSVFGLTDAPLEPVTFQPAEANLHPSPETVIVNLSDWQWGEDIKFGAMDGLNSYNPDIASDRAERCFQAILDLMTKHWAGPPPARLILILGGDMISGEIHLELIRTQTLMALPAVKQVVSHIKAGINLLLDNLKCPIDVISIPGNHGRSTMKPESKLHAETSYDNLVADFLEAEMRGTKNYTKGRLQFFVPASGDALFSVYGWRFLVTHGDKIGSRGGHGFIGPVAAIARGHKKLVMDYAARGEHVDFILTGHFHTACKTEEGYGNGSLAGPSEYSRDGRFRPLPATQIFLAVHPRRGISQFRFINVGAPEEGSLYERPEAPEFETRPTLLLNR